eukprot:CAMPEP_0201568726 /NCGR_PEP_ID=MMETSP0190_2-20130828/9941_1 /ASSEMBLY_ACC=CAM_ASM_000263 /TAXON_ID=37353 /ORGANISM="Rosalina sp." /LENGTH=666 /DNA_ID=CAMNT_0047990161 /DNA_START=99 /DNA_END=2096 /DNA_ORIENTATION=-
MEKSIQSLLLISLTLIYSIESDQLPYNPLDALQWNEIDLFDQIQDGFKQQVLTGSGGGFGGDALGETTESKIGFEVRTLNGLENNKEYGFGSMNSKAQRCMDPVYADGINEPNGKTRMNPREISNVISKQEPEDAMKFVNERFLTQFAWQWGQFIDHDVTLISEARDVVDHTLDTGDIHIYVPCNDPEFDPEETCDADIEIELFRTLPFGGSGTSKENPRMQTNEITSFIDASMIYGSDDDRSKSLRSFSKGKLAVTDDNFLPRNSRGIRNEPNKEERFVIAGDIRPNEQLGLLTMHTIWVRFHNVIAEEVAESIDASGIAQRDEDSFDEIVYQYTKLIVTAVVQKITYKDWLPTMFGRSAIADFLGDYNGYDPEVNPSACLIFSSAAYRLGHTLLPNFLPLRENDCTIWKIIDECDECDSILGGIELKESFFVPEVSEKYDENDHTSFMGALLNGYSCTLANEIDVSITGAVRNFLFESARNGPNGEGDHIFEHLDLIAINLARAREHGLPDYNSVREHVGLNKFDNFGEMTSDPELQDNFEKIYGDINDVDLFLGLLAEDHLEDGSFGETISAVVLQQFGRLRDGDRFWYQRYIKSGELLDFIECMTLKSVIELTTDISNIDALDSVRHNIFQNKRAISIFAGVETFQAQAISETNIIPQNNKW